MSLTSIPTGMFLVFLPACTSCCMCFLAAIFVPWACMLAPRHGFAIAKWCVAVVSGLLRSSQVWRGWPFLRGAVSIWRRGAHMVPQTPSRSPVAVQWLGVMPRLVSKSISSRPSPSPTVNMYNMAACQSRSRLGGSSRRLAPTHTRTHTHTHTHTCTGTRTRTCTHTQTQTYQHAKPNARTHAHPHLNGSSRLAAPPGLVPVSFCRVSTARVPTARPHSLARLGCGQCRGPAQKGHWPLSAATSAQPLGCVSAPAGTRRRRTARTFSFRKDSLMRCAFLSDSASGRVLGSRRAPSHPVHEASHRRFPSAATRF